MDNLPERLRAYLPCIIRSGDHAFAGLADDIAEAAETILALRKEVEEAKANAALARQGYETAYAEFDGKCRAVNKLAAELAEANETIIAFSAPWAVTYARDYGFPDGHLHPTHFDILAKAGGRMDDFKRAALATEAE